MVCIYNVYFLRLHCTMSIVMPENLHSLTPLIHYPLTRGQSPNSPAATYEYDTKAKWDRNHLNYSNQQIKIELENLKFN